MEHLLKHTLISILLFGLIGTNISAQMIILKDAEKGTMTVKDGKVGVLTYRFGDQLKEGIDPEQTRSWYLHPLYSLDGRIPRNRSRFYSIRVQCVRCLLGRTFCR